MKTIEVSDETYEKIKDQIEADKKKEKMPKFDIQNINGIEVGVRPNSIFPLFIQTAKKGFVNEEHNGMIGERANLLDLDESRKLIKALQSAIDHVEADK